MIARLLVTRFVTLSLTTTTTTTTTSSGICVSSYSPAALFFPMLRRSPRRRTVVSGTCKDDFLESAASSCSVTPLQTPVKKRRRKARNNEEEALTPRLTPSTPDLCDSSASPPPVVSTLATNNRIDEKNGLIDLCVPPEEFRPSASLTTGQSFHWKALSSSSSLDETNPAIAASSSSSAWGAHDATDWIGTLRDTGTGQSVVVHVRQVPHTTLYKVLYAPDGVDVDAFLREYFQLNVSLSELYETWSTACPRLRQIAQCIPGVRILQQDPWETLLSFICSSNNNIPRITQILSTLRREYGQPIELPLSSECDGINQQGERAQVYSFPSLEELRSQVTKKDLRRLGWGYRAKYVIQTMETLNSLGGESYLSNLRNQETDPVVVQEALLQFAGVGRKVADCCALFSLRQTRAIPVDVHVWNIARRDYDPDDKLAMVKSLTPTIYKQVGDIFRNRFGDYAGWAHSLLFVAELPSFRPVLPQALIQEMEDFRQVEQARKQELKEAKAKSKETV